MKFGTMFLYDVAVPELSLNNLTYESSCDIPTGARVKVEVSTHSRTGFILGFSKDNLDPEVKIKKIEKIFDDRPIIPPDLWDMALYAGRISFCGAAPALRVILPRYLILPDARKIQERNFYCDSKNYCRENFFNPIDSERFDFYINELKQGGRTLILFSRKENAKKFFDSLPDELKKRTLLWGAAGTEKYWLSWLDAYFGKFDFVIGSAGAIFAPLMPQKIIVEDEASRNFIIPPVLNVSARDLAEHRAKFLGAKFITGGRQPSLKTFKDFRPEEKILPERKNIIFTDIFHYKTRREEEKGIEGNIPLTFSLIKNTYKELMNKNSVIWILDRLGDSSEVFCARCGEIIKCPKCGSPMRSENDGKILSCKICSQVQDLPEKCEKCGFEVLTGRRPGLETLEKIAGKYYEKIILYVDKPEEDSEDDKDNKKTKKKKKPPVKKNSLFLTTRSGLELCDKIQPSLIAWLDLDLELSFPGHDNKLELFSLLWDSYWRGREKNSERKVLIQSRRQGMNTAKFLTQGWTKFLDYELAERQEFNLPPYGHEIELEIEPKASKLREKILDAFFGMGIFVMDSGDETEPLRLNLESLEPLEEILNAVKFSSKQLKITVKN